MAAFSFALYYNLNRRFGQISEDFFKKINLIRNFSLNTSPDALCFFGYSYIMYRVEYYPCGGTV